MDKGTAAFDEIFRQNERRIHYHIHRLNIQDPHQEYFQEGLVAMWNAYEKYEPDKGPMATYFNFIIQKRMMDLRRIQYREAKREETPFNEEHDYQSEENAYSRLPQDASESSFREAFWEEVREMLTENQWKWVRFSVIANMPVKEIAEQEGVTAEAVKSWGKAARRKLRKVMSKGGSAVDL
ncbi:sigma-70 family RNA polymerase sigma factor [Lentibacillus jeotgali]|uniref:sigma-70 family RNA polymerase sigma factor n=1 Tax=Lentibacillus jeotgali TaxID=558169 RepID=UPI0002628068|nr:sigma-70 family RNA polymerase sigma factor [Lentibacillus jeotgali]